MESMLNRMETLEAMVTRTLAENRRLQAQLEPVRGTTSPGNLAANSPEPPPGADGNRATVREGSSSEHIGSPSAAAATAASGSPGGGGDGGRANRAIKFREEPAEAGAPQPAEPEPKAKAKPVALSSPLFSLCSASVKPLVRRLY